MRNEQKLPPYRIDDVATRTFVEAIANGHRPIGIVGSGLSLIYGAVNWEESVELALDYAIEFLKRVYDKSATNEVLAPYVDQIDRARLLQQKKALQTYYPNKINDLVKKAKSSSSPMASAPDKYVALDLCGEALAQIDDIEERVRRSGSGKAPVEALACPILSRARRRHPNVGRFRGFMAEIYKNDTQLIRHRIARRFELDKGRIAKLNGMEDKDVHRLSAMIFSLPSIQFLVNKFVTNDNLLGSLVDDLIVWMGWLQASKFVNSSPVIPVDRRSIMTLILAEIDTADRRKYFDECVLNLKKMSSNEPPMPFHRPLLDPIQAVERWFGLRRFLTLNFDYQLERALMLDDHVAIADPPADVESALDAKLLHRQASTGTLDRLFADGLLSASDLYKREALDRLFEFGLNSPDYQSHVLHLHGRADEPDSMVLTDTDSNRQYRRDPDTADMLEHALDVALTGNPILFMGVGLSEPEITRALRELVSRSDASLEQPAFTTQTLPGSAEPGDSSAWRMQQSYLRQNGIHVFVVGAETGGAPVEPPCSGTTLQNQLNQLNELRKDRLVRSPDLAQSAAVFKDLRNGISLLKDGSLSKWEKRNKTIEDAKKCWFVDVDNLWMDNSAFLFFINQIEKVDNRISSSKANSWLDYITAVEKKTIALAQYKKLKSIRDKLEEELASPFLAKEYSPEKYQTDFSENLPKEKPVAIRDEQFATPVDQAQWTSRHGRDVSWGGGLPDFDLNPAPLLLIKGPFGSGKGSLATQIRRKLPPPGLFINLSFGIEIDSVVSHVLRFIAGTLSFSTRGLVDRITQIREALAQGSEQRVGKKTRKPFPILLSGVERLFDRDGRILVAEFELLLGTLLHPDLKSAGFRLILLGTDECARALAALARVNGASLQLADIDNCWRDYGFVKFVGEKVAAHCKAELAPTSLGKSLQLAMAYSPAPLVPNGVRSRQSSEVLKLVLRRWHELHDFSRKEAELDRAILGALAIVGMPIEAAGLVPMPGIVQLYPDKSPVEILHEIERSLKRLVEFGLVAKLEARASQSKVKSLPRFAVHRSLLAELRENLSARSGEEPISNSFSISLAASMPTDLKLPDSHVLAELEHALGRLRGAWKDPGRHDTDLQALSDAALALNKPPMGSDDIGIWRRLAAFEHAVRMTDKPMPVYQRAAAGIIRGFFSGASLVGQFPSGDPAPSLGRMEHHKRRIGLLLQQVRYSQQAGNRAEALAGELKKALTPKKAKIDPLLTDTIDRLVDAAKASDNNQQPHALYGNEILWLLNEQAVIAIIQGCLMDAMRLLNEADKANKLFRSKTPGAIIWRRLEINRAFVLIERGQLAEARSRLLAIAPAVRGRKLYLPNEDALTQPLVDGYLGLCEHLSGRYDDAETLFRASIRGARRTRQQRAQAISQIRLAALQFGRGEIDVGMASIQDAIAIAQNGRQMDIVWRAKTTSLAGLRTQNGRREADEIIAGALAYAHEMGTPRLRVEALKQRAELLLALGDNGSAARAAASAMATASRNGMVLQKVSLRVIMGRILLSRGDKSGLQMLHRAASLADRIGYQLMVERALAAIHSHPVS